MANRKEPKRAKRKGESPTQADVVAAQRTLVSMLAIADPGIRVEE